MDINTKLGLGSALATIGAFGIIVVPIMGWSKVGSPWDFILGFLFGVSAGVGVALAVHALIQKRSRK